MNRIAFTALAAALCASCSSDPELPDDPSAMTGAIVARNIPTPVGAGRPTLHVKTNPADACGVIFAIDSKTELLARTSNNQVREADLSEFTVGAKVRVWSGAIAESCPGQGVADTMELLP